MRQPAFWNRHPSQPGVMARLLSPLGYLYGQATKRRISQAPDLVPEVPVVCIGNINIGGVGKTPTVVAIAELMSDRVVHVVSRGYGSSLTGPVRVDERTHSAAEVGDEPLLLSAFMPTWVSKKRELGVEAAISAGAELVLLDDGFQNPSVKKSLSFVVADAYRGFGNGRVIPAGPLREPVAEGMSRADAVIIIGDDTGQRRFDATWSSEVTVPRFKAELAPLETGMDWQGLRVVAFAGIGLPEKFFVTLKDLGAEIVSSHALDDHQALTDALLKRLEMEAQSLGAQLVTTEKDAVRLPPAFRAKVLAVPVRLKFSEPAAVKGLINSRL